MRNDAWSASNRPHVQGPVSDDDLIELLRYLLSIPSPTGQEMALAESVKDILTGIGFERVTVDSGANVVAVARRQASGPRIMLLCQSDTPVSNQPNTGSSCATAQAHATMQATIEGVGAATKGVLASMIAAASRLCERDLCGELMLVMASHDLAANHDGIREVHQAGINADIAICGEPTACRPALAARGLAHLRITVRGLPSHAGNPERGINPISGLARLLVGLQSVVLPMHPQLGMPTINPIELSTSRHPPLSPETASCILDCRLLPDMSAEHIREIVSAVAQSLRPQLHEPVQVELLRSMYPVEVAPQSALAQDLKAAMTEIGGLEPEAAYLSFSSNAGYLQSEIGAEVVMFGPGDVDATHEVSMHDVLLAAQVYERTIRRTWQRWCG